MPHMATPLVLFTVLLAASAPADTHAGRAAQGKTLLSGNWAALALRRLRSLLVSAREWYAIQPRTEILAGSSLSDVYSRALREV